MNIIILTSSKSHQGGVERFSFYLEKILTEQGHQVTLLGREDLSAVQRKILALKKIVGMEQPALGYFLGRHAQHQGYDACVTNGMLGWNLQGQNIINVQHGTFARSADRIDRGRNVLKFFMKKFIWGFFEGLAARRAHFCVAVSQEVRESVMRYYHRNEVIVIPNATDIQFFKPYDRVMSRGKMKLSLDGKIAIFVGRFEPAKGKDILEGFRDYLHQQGGQLIVAEHYSQEELVLLYNAADVFLLPSLQEGCSYALLDAMACGLPFLASPVGLVPELEAKGLFTECIVHTKNIQDYIAAFEQLMDKSETERVHLSEQLRQYILEHHSIEQFSKNYNKLIHDISPFDTRP